jgi:hypothetical protein
MNDKAKPTWADKLDEVFFRPRPTDKGVDGPRRKAEVDVIPKPEPEKDESGT